MRKKTIKLIIALTVVLIFFVLAFLALLEVDNENLLITETDRNYNMIFFTGDGCEHCLEVEIYVEEKNLSDKLSLVTKEVYNNVDNLEIFEDKFNQCSPQPRDYGIPFLWDNNYCLVGPVEIINYLEASYIN